MTEAAGLAFDTNESYVISTLMPDGRIVLIAEHQGEDVPGAVDILE